MNLLDYGRIFARRAWIVVVLAILAAGASFYLSKQQQPIYRSIQTVLIQPARSDNGLTISSKELLSNYSLYLASSYRAADVIDKLQLDMTPLALLGAVKVVPDQLTLSIKISVDLPDGEMANRVAKAWGELLVQFRQAENQKVQRSDQVNALLQDNPNYNLDHPRPSINAIAGAVLGVIVGAIIIFVLEYLESSVIRRREDLERVMEIAVLAAIPESN
jgi:capsular polysaccharide biosynthesis protein